MTMPPRRVGLATLALRRRLKQLADALVPPEVAILDISNATGTTQLATAFAELGIADALGDHAITAAKIADQLGTDADTTHRLLRTAHSVGLCRMNPRTGTVTLTRTGRPVLADSAMARVAAKVRVPSATSMMGASSPRMTRAKWCSWRG